MIPTVDTHSNVQTSVSTALPDSKASWIDALLLGGILAVMLYGIGDYGLYEPHEGHFAGVGREMVAGHDWITPHLNGAQYLNKPPLFYWAIALSYTLLGVQTEFAARLPLALIGWGGVVLVWSWSRKLWGIRAGRMAAVMLAVSAGWYLFCHQLLIDALLSVLNLSALYLMWRAIGRRYERMAWVWFYLCVGLCVLAKGLIGLAFPAVALLTFIAWRRDWSLIRDSHPLTGTGIISVVIAAWIIPLEFQIPGTVKYMLWSEHYDRMLDQRWPPDYSVVKVNWWKYLGITMVWLMPWGLLLPQVFRFCRTQNPLPADGPERRRADAVLLLAIAAALPVVLFLPMPARLIYYSLPCVLPFVMLAAGWWTSSQEPEQRKNRWIAGISFATLGAGLVVVHFFLAHWLKNIPDIAGAKGMLKLIPEIALLIGVALLAGGVILNLRKTALSLAIIGVFLGAADLVCVQGFANYDPVLSSKKLVGSIFDKVGGDCIWVSEGSKEIGASAGIAFYLGRDADGHTRNVFIMKDDTRRPPPVFPGPPLTYLIDHARLESMWNGDKPVLFITDFQRSDWLGDYPRLPSDIAGCIATPECGNRRIYANKAAWKRLNSETSSK